MSWGSEVGVIIGSLLWILAGFHPRDTCFVARARAYVCFATLTTSSSPTTTFLVRAFGLSSDFFCRLLLQQRLLAHAGR